MENPLILLLVKVPGIVFGFTFHEFAHGLVAYLFGDNTPKKEGRLTLNPLAHMDIIGLIMIFYMNFGWAKPVHTNPSNFKKRKLATLLVSLAGCVANILLAVLFAGLLKLLFVFNVDTEKFSLLYISVYYAITINLVLGIFNLIPLPPLDGSKILFNFISPRSYFKIIRYEYILQILLIVLVVTGIIPALVNPVIDYCLVLLEMLYKIKLI